VTASQSTMLAASLRAPYDIEVVELPRPIPGRGEVLLRMLANGICGSDLHFWHHGPVGPPGVLGHEMAAEVVAVGPDVADGWLGRRGAVWAGDQCGACAYCVEGLGHFCSNPPNSLGGFRPGTLGGLAQFAVIEPARMLADHCGLDPAIVTLAEPLANAIRSLDRDQTRDARHCVVLGAGPLGLAHIAIARTLGFERVVAVEGRPRRAEVARSLGADEVLDPVSDVRGRIAGWFGVGVDLVVDCVGAQATTHLGGVLCRPGGTLLLMGICGAPVRVNTYRWIEKELTIRTSVGTGADDQRRALELLQSGVVDGSQIVTARISLDEVPAAFAELDAGSDEVKIVVEHRDST
jgi:2-desacetyl-2-hydroxyethyl bacteriochlorophyllide A dehydrogenase